MTPSPMTPTDIDALQKRLRSRDRANARNNDVYRSPRETIYSESADAIDSLLSEVKALREALRECGEHKEAPYGVTLIANAALGRSNTP